MRPVNTVPSLSSLHLSQGLPSKTSRVTSPALGGAALAESSLTSRTLSLPAIWLPGQQVFRPLNPVDTLREQCSPPTPSH